MEYDIEGLKRQLAQLKELHEAGTLPVEQYQEGKAVLERRVLDLVLSGATTSAPQSASAASLNASDPALRTSTAADRPSRKLLASLVAAVVVVAGVGYWAMGSPDHWSIGPSASSVSASAVANGEAGSGAGTAASHPTDTEQIAGMVDRLATRLKEQPQDPEGWAMLARSFTVLGRHSDALEAYQKAIAQRGDDAQLYADYADSLAVKNNRSLSGEPMKMVAKALQLDAKNVKALALAGTDAFDRKDYAGAVKYWEQAVQFAAPDSNYAKQIQASLAEARERSGLPAKAMPAAAAAGKDASAPAIASESASAAGPTVRGTVSLAASLAGLAAPNDTVFVFARAAEGQRIPLAVLRKQVKDLPFEFTLDDSMAMSPAAKISGAKSVIVMARVSKSGEALPQSGDLAGQVGPVSLGASGLKLEIREAVKN
jgi:cytochrome c-type biogenesis protein CcmH